MRYAVINDRIDDYDVLTPTDDFTLATERAAEWAAENKHSDGVTGIYFLDTPEKEATFLSDLEIEGVDDGTAVTISMTVT